MARQSRRPPARDAAELHRAWLALFDLDGPFLAVPVLRRVWPNGIPDFRTVHPGRLDLLSDARRAFEASWEALDRQPGDEKRQSAFRAARDQWVETVLRDVVGWGDMLDWGPVPGVRAESPNRAVTVTAQAVLRGPDGHGALVHVIDPVDSLRETPSDLWAATPVDRLEALLRSSGTPIGIVTDGRWWGLVHAADDTMTASGVVDALTWTEEARARDAFLTLVSRQHLVGGDPAERLPALFGESVAAAEEVTDALGSQVRQAVELLVQSFSESALDARSRGQGDPLPEATHEVYEAAVMMMMRTVFLLFAEERGLLPSGELFEHGYGISGELDRLTLEGAQGEESLDATALTWHRLLATSRAVYLGAAFENIRMPAYGGSLFDPSRFGFLNATSEQGTLSVRVTDRVMFHVLRSIQVVTVRGEARRISFRDIDVEQIGYIYEGLLGYTCTRAQETMLGLIGKTGSEPEIPLEHLEGLAAENPDSRRLADAIREWLQTTQPSAEPPTTAALSKALAADADPAAVSALSQTVDGDTELIHSITPWLAAIRRDLRGRPFIVRAGGLLVTETPSRRNAGAHYTPKSLAEEVVLHALQPLCYSPGPHQTSDEAAWRLRSSDDLLGLRVADIACGSGAFLVAAARYLADRVVEAWISEDQRNAGRRDLHMRAVRQVVAGCLYGADINEMAVEMCKLSLWLVSLDRDLPFSFVDDKVFHGNSLLGLTTLNQLRKLHIDPSRVPLGRPFGLFDVDIDSIIDKAVDLRKRLSSEINEDDPMRSSAAKRRQLDELQRVTSDLRRIADGVIAAGLPLGGKPGRALDEAYDNLRLAVKQAYPDAGAAPSAAWLDGLIDRGLTPTVTTDYHRWKPLHWAIEVPDVIVDHGGFDAIIGNPPFLRVSAQSSSMGEELRDFIIEVVAAGDRGMADFVAYFYRRAAQLVTKSESSLGLIATNSIRQNHSSRVGLAPLLADGFAIRVATQSKPWPGEASLHYSMTVLSRCEIPGAYLDGRWVPRINAILEEEHTYGIPTSLEENDGLSFEGSKLTGTGFILDQDEYRSLLGQDPRLGEIIRPYLVAEDVNGRPDQSASRWAIDFGTMSIDEARRFELAFDRIEELVKPQRLSSKRKSDRERWWQYGETRPGLYRQLAHLKSAVVVAVVSKYLSVTMCRADQIFSNRLIVVPDDSYARFGVLTSSIHEVWVRQYSGLLEDRLVYNPTSAFRTFPFPPFTKQLEDAGRTFANLRGSALMTLGIGYTELMNRLSHPSLDSAEFLNLRQAQEELDAAVASAYGWPAPVPLEFVEWRGMRRWAPNSDARAWILQQLLETHRERKTSAPNLEPRRASKQSRTSQTETLFDNSSSEMDS